MKTIICGVCAQKVKIIEAQPDYWRVTDHSQIKQLFILCPGSGKQIHQNEQTYNERKQKQC